MDWGTVIMNVGAVSGLCGFMMSDVLYLRALSVAGSMCGITYNLTRSPRQLNACLWGGVFIATNLYMVRNLLDERNAEGPQFNVQEMELFQRHFKEYGVDHKTYKKMVSSESCRWEKFNQGDEIVAAGQPLNRVLILHEGKARAYKVGFEGELKYRKEMYKYEGRGRNGCIVGGTALVDPKTTKHNYPHSVLADSNETIVVSWNREMLKQLMEESPTLESAFVHTMYVDLISGLRRQRSTRDSRIIPDEEEHSEGGEAESSEEIFENQKDVVLPHHLPVYMYYGLLEDAVQKDGVSLDPRKKRIARKYAFKHGISLAQHVRAVGSVGWTRHEWQDGIKEVVPEEIVETSST